jgi:hypothetical protein
MIITFFIKQLKLILLFIGDSSNFQKHNLPPDEKTEEESSICKKNKHSDVEKSFSSLNLGVNNNNILDESMVIICYSTQLIR